MKRLFIDRNFITGRDDPEENEDPADYVFIPATVEDNEALLRASPGYLRLLSALPEDLRRACRYGGLGGAGRELFFRVRQRHAHLRELRAAAALAALPQL